MNTFRQFLLEFESTLQYHDELNPKLWDGEKLKRDVREHLLKIAKAWADFAEIPNSAIVDIIMTGGNANFNYTKYSDIDLHLLVHKKKIASCDEDVLDDYLKDKKNLWSLNHEIKIHGYDVELYAQDVDEPTSKDQGTYSVMKDKWISEPKKVKVNLGSREVKRKVLHLKNMIDFFVDSQSDDVDEMEKFKDKLRSMRSAAIQKGGEYSIENLAFKELRNLGYLDKFSDYIINVQDKSLSLKGKP